MKKIVKNISIAVLSLLCAFGLSLAFQHFDVEEHITTVFVFSVFFISLFTEGYLYGVCAAFLGTIAVNYAFTFPYFALNFTIPVNLISGAIMIAIAVLTSALTTKLKQHEAMKAESEKERLRADLLRAVSHDIRTPLTTIYGSSATLLENRAELPDLAALENEVDTMKKELTASHFARLAEGDCSMDVSPYYSSAVAGLERVADHLVNVGYSIVSPIGSQN
jgi:two-component system sensor histidine kinase KdpD